MDRSVTQVGYSDPVIQNGMIIAQEIKVTLGMNQLSLDRYWKYLIKLGKMQGPLIETDSFNKTICSEAIISVIITIVVIILIIERSTTREWVALTIISPRAPNIFILNKINKNRNDDIV